MIYLQPSEYEQYGLEATTPASWVTAASAMVDAHCRRATLGVVKYSERVRVNDGRNSVRLTYLPLAISDSASSPIVSMRGRYAMPRRGESANSDFSSDVATAFGLPGTWSELDATQVDCCVESGEISVPLNTVGLSYNELEIAYTAGLDPIPSAVKVACAQIVRNAQATPALNVRAGNLDRMHLEYFADTLIDQNVRALLAPYVAQKVG
ncbi:MAG TPA: hypothetical protein VHR84_06890 [Terriglobales bacterium]|jgi:hypothetical protein|nr:hypothetical protein [Terriglobales bacterium]